MSRNGGIDISKSLLASVIIILHLWFQLQVQYLLSLGIPKEQVARAIDRCPQILTYSLEQRVLPLERKLGDHGIKVVLLHNHYTKLNSRYQTGFRNMVIRAQSYTLSFLAIHARLFM